MYLNMTTDQLLKSLLDKIPLVHHMGVGVTACSLEKVSITAELEKNRNHRHTAFGGSLNTILTLAAWSWLTNFLAEKDLETQTEVVIQDCHSRYLKPVVKDFCATGWSPLKAEQDRFLEALARKGVARIAIKSEVLDKDILMADFVGQFVVVIKK